MRKRPPDLAIDLGTANTLVFARGEGIVYDEPTVVALDNRRRQVLGAGTRAWELAGRSPSGVIAVRPLRSGAITDYDVTQEMLRFVLRAVGVTRFARPKAIVCVSSGLTPVEVRAVQRATESAGARSVALVEEPLAAAVGIGLPIGEPVGSLLVDIGGGTSEVALFSMGGVVARRSLRVGGFDMDAAVQLFLRRRRNLAVGERVAELAKIAGASAFPTPHAGPVEVRGRDLTSGMPETVVVSDEELRGAIAEPVRAIVEAVQECLGATPPELGQDILERGMFLTGGSSLLHGLDARLSHDCEVPVHLTDTPLETVVRGAGRCLELPDLSQLLPVTGWR